MANYSSRAYGLKVKERVNYFPFGDSKGKVTLSYSDGLWIVKAGDTTEEDPPENVEWWFNGAKFQNGETIITFNDGDVVTYNIMETHTDVIPYKNYMYDIYGGSAENINYGTEDISYKITPFDSTGRFYKSIKVYETKNGLISSDKVINSIDIVSNKRVYDKPLKAYNMLFDWIDNKFKIISDSNYIKYNGNPVSKGFTIRIVEPDNFDEFEVTDETNKHYAKEVGKDAVPKITLCKRNGGKNITTSTKDRNTIYSDVFHDHVKAYYNGKYHEAMYLVWDTTGAAGCWKKTIKDSLVMTYAHPYWFLMTTKDGVEYNGTTYLARKLIRTWKPETVVDMTLRRQKTRKLEKPADGNFDKIIYDVYEDENSDSVTVKYQKVVSRTEYIDLDSVTFSSSAGTVLFHNIEFRCRNGKWTIYSKCGFITYGGRKYLKNKAILSFNVAEAIHININDESNKYVVDTVTTWRIRTPDSDVTLDYAIHTSESAKTMKVVKSTNGEEEPWITVYYYEAIHQAYEVDDISFKYDVKKQEWELYSNSDKLYYNGENKKLGELLKTWKYNEIVKISGISVTHVDTDSIMVEKKETSTSGMITNNDIDEDIDWYSEEEPDLHISYAYSKNVWKITALRECFVSGTRYSERDVIATFKSKESVSSFTVMVPHDDEGEIVNVLYSFEVSISVKGITTVHVDSHRYGEKAYNDKDINSVANETMIFTTQDAKSMYGYIWKRFGGPTPPPGPRDYDWDIFAIGVYDDYNGYKMAIAIDTTFGSRYAKRLYQTGDYAVFRDMGSYSLDTGDVGYLSTVYAENHNMYLNRLECVVYGNESNVSVSIRSSVSGNVINILSGSNDVEVFNISIDTESSIINKKTYNKYLNSIISEINTTIGPMWYDVNFSFFCISGRRLYIHQGLTYRSITPGSIGCLVIDMDTCELIETKQTINIDVDAIAEEMWSTISSIEKEVFFSNSIRNAKNALQNGGVGHSAYINDEMIVNAGYGGVVYSSTYGRVALFWYKFYRFNPVNWTLSVISTNYGDSNVPAYYGMVQNTRNKQLCTYIQDYNISANIDIYKLSEYSIDGLINAEKVTTINPSDTVQLWRLDTNSYQTFTKGEIFEAIRAYGGRQRQSLPYSTRSSRFKTYTSGNFGYIQNGYDRWIICITDETLQDFSESFCFLASELSSRGTLDEHNYRPGPQ